MPRGFEMCQKAKGKIRRVSGPSKEHGLKKGQYVNFCVKGGKSYRGYVKKSKKK